MMDLDEKLNALLDGEASPAEAADTAQAMQDDPVLAARFAALARLRAATRLLGADNALPVMALPRSRPRWPVVAAGAALVALAVALAPWAWPARTQDASMDEAHRRFLAAMPDAVLAASSLPDLTAAGLQLARLEPSADGTYAGYVGPRGCRLGLWIGPRGAAPPAIVEAGWRSVAPPDDAGRHVIWLAPNAFMDAARFAALSDLLRQGRGGGPMAASLASDRSPCAA